MFTSTEYLIKVLLDIGGKLGSSIRKERFGETVIFLDVSVVDFSSFFYFCSNYRDKISYFNIIIDKDENISI